MTHAPQAPERHDDGFVLIGAIWLLLLCTALVAVLMMRARTTAQAAVQEGTILQRRLDDDAVAQTIGAELLLQGAGSRWWKLPAEGAVVLGRRSFVVRITSEAGRLDLNDGDPAVITGALEGMGFASAARQGFVDALLEQRGRGRIGSTAEIDALTSTLGTGSAGVRCVSELFTAEGGRSTPEIDRAEERLARALGVPAAAPGAQLRPGEALRIEVRQFGGAATTVIARIGIVGERTISVSRSWIGGCS